MVGDYEKQAAAEWHERGDSESRGAPAKDYLATSRSLDLSPPSVHTHINDMMKSELLRESEEWEKKYPTERYYEPNFPVFKAEEYFRKGELSC